MLTTLPEVVQILALRHALHGRAVDRLKFRLEALARKGFPSGTRLGRGRAVPLQTRHLIAIWLLCEFQAAAGSRPEHAVKALGSPQGQAVLEELQEFLTNYASLSADDKDIDLVLFVYLNGIRDDEADVDGGDQSEAPEAPSGASSEGSLGTASWRGPAPRIAIVEAHTALRLVRTLPGSLFVSLPRLAKDLTGYVSLARNITNDQALALLLEDWD